MYVCPCCVCVCVFPPRIPNHGRASLSQVHSSIHQILGPRRSAFYLYMSDPVSFCLSVCLSVCDSLSVGFRSLNYFPLRPTTSQVTSSLSLTFRVRAALGKRRRTDLPMQATAELLGGQLGACIASLSHKLGLYSGLVVI